MENINRIRQFSENDKKFLELQIEGELKKEIATEICTEWKQITSDNIATKFNIIINAKEMKDYEPSARATFQNTLTELKGNIEKVWLITESKLISAGASIMNVFTSIPIKVLSSESDIVSQ